MISPSVPFQYWEIIKYANTFQCCLNQIEHHRGKGLLSSLVGTYLLASAWLSAGRLWPLSTPSRWGRSHHSDASGQGLPVSPLCLRPVGPGTCPLDRGTRCDSEGTRNLGTEHRASHYNDVIMGTMASQITGISIVYSTVCSGADQRKHQSSASLVFVRRIHRGPVNSPHKMPVTRKMSPTDDVIINIDLVRYIHILISTEAMFIFFNDNENKNDL